MYVLSIRLEFGVKLGVEFGDLQNRSRLDFAVRQLDGYESRKTLIIYFNLMNATETVRLIAQAERFSFRESSCKAFKLKERRL